MKSGDDKMVAEACLATSHENFSSQPIALYEFYRTLHGYITDFGVSEDEMEDIQTAVEETVGKFADLVAAIEPMYKARSVHGVGSFYEKTKILKLDEFDFSYVIDELSNENRIEIGKVFTENVLGLTVKVNDIHYFEHSKWFTDTADNGSCYLGMLNFLPTKATLYVRDPQQTFSDVLSKAAHTVRSQTLSCEKASGTLTLLGEENKVGPNIELWFEWTPKHGKKFVIKSDITPVIRLHDVAGMVTEEECEHPAYLAKLYSTGSYFVMPSKLRHMQIPFTFSPTFTETERDLMAGLDTSHKMAYRCLKFLLLDFYTRRNPLYWDLQQYLEPAVFPDLEFRQILNKLDYLTVKSFLSSYCLKVALLKHSCKCDRQGRPDLCGLDVIEILLDCAKREHPVLNGIFIKQDNLFRKLTQFDRAKDLDLMVKVLGMLKNFHEQVLYEKRCGGASVPMNDFRNLFSKLIAMSKEYGLQSEDSIMEFNTSNFSQGFLYNAYKFAHETNNILDDTAMEPDNKKILLKNANLFYNFDLSEALSTASLAMEDNLYQTKEKLEAYRENMEANNSAARQSEKDLEEQDVDKCNDDVTVIYSRF